MKSSGLFSSKQLQMLAAGDEKVLNDFDAQGLFPGIGESAEEFAARMGKLSAALEKLHNDLKKTPDLEVASGIRINEKNAISGNVTNEALAQTGALYNVRPEWVPGFFANESFGIFWGGCSLSDPDSGLSLFIIRKAFKKKPRWLFYRRQELLAHEMTHASHQAFTEWMFEEYFAYQTASSALRKFFGGCFIHKFDSLGFIGPILLLPVMQFLNLFQIVNCPMGFFWCLAGVYPAFLALRTCWINRIAGRARKFLIEKKAPHPGAALFRMSVAEIKTLAAGRMPQGNDLRWKILQKYLDNGQE